MSSHAAGSAPRQRVNRGVWIIGICIALTLVLGSSVEIFFPIESTPGCPAVEHESPHWFWRLFEIVYNTLSLFHIEYPHFAAIVKCHHNIWLAIAAILGPASFLATIGGVFWLLLDDQRKAWRIKRARKHLVVIGYGAKGRERASEAAHNGQRVIVIESNADEAAITHANAHGVLIVEGDGSDNKILARARVDHAASVVVATGDDARNLGICRLAVDQIGKQRGRIVETAIGSPLMRRALAAHEGPLSIEIFSIEELVAYHLCDVVRFFAIADLLGQPRVHVVIVGFGATATHVVAQILRTNIVAGLGPPAITILSSRPEEARNALRLAYPGAEKVAAVRAIHYHPLARPPDDLVLMDEVDKAGPITAVVTLNEEGFEAVTNALAIREAAHRTGRWRAAIFFARDAHKHFGMIEHRLEGTKLYSDVLDAFETSAALCTVQRTNERDRLARAIHERFRVVQRELRALGKTPSTTEALHEWDDLPATFRQSSRRAADHVPAKLASAGCFLPDGPITLSIDADQIVASPLFEALAELEHEAWMAERKLEGWRPGPVRDDRSRIHDLLVPYEELLDESKELDRDQIRTLLTKTLPRAAREPDPKAVRFDLWIGLIGTTDVARTDATRLADDFAEAVSRIIEARPSHHITLLSPLAPGADLIATKKALALLKAARRPHRLLVPNVVRPREVVDNFETRWRAGAVADLDVSAGPEWVVARKTIIAEIERLIAQPECERILELATLPHETTEKQRQWGYRLQNAYIVERAHVVIAAVKGDGPPEPGGTREAVLWRRSPETIPDEFRRYRKRPNPLGPGLSDLITIDLNTR
jgi:Trk K+ transport system NAD-binding subunit